MNRHLRNRLQYHRHLVNTLSALSATAVMLVATLMISSPAGISAEQSVARNSSDDASVSKVPAPRKLFDPGVVQARAHDIESRAEQLATQLEKTRSASQAIAHVAAFTAEVATVAALTAALDELPESVETAEIAVPAPIHASRKHKRTRQSLAMPYFSFASRS